MLFDDNDFNFDFSFFEIPGSDFNRVDNILAPKEGFLKGNLFRNEYVPYKKYTYLPIEPKSKREEKLCKIQELSFAINDLNLYLDLHPEDNEAYNLMKKYVYEMNRLMVEYDKMYGPLTLDEVEQSKYEWIDNPWPWDNEGGHMYV